MTENSLRKWKELFLKGMIVISALLIVNTVYAQSVIFSSDQWPKRWERVMKHRPFNGHNGQRQLEDKGFNLVDNRSDRFKKINHRENRRVQRWGQQPEQRRHKRSQTPEYNYQTYRHQLDGVSQRQRYAIDPVLNRNYLSNSNYYRNFNSNYSGMGMSTYPTVYPEYYSGFGAPNIVTPGFGGYGAPYTEPLLMGQGIPMLGYPSGLSGYPGLMGHPW